MSRPVREARGDECGRVPGTRRIGHGVERLQTAQDGIRAYRFRSRTSDVIAGVARSEFRGLRRWLHSTVWKYHPDCEFSSGTL